MGEEVDCDLSDLGLIWTDYAANVLFFFIYTADFLREDRDDFIALYRVFKSDSPCH
jgi:hypothetical protein